MAGTAVQLQELGKRYLIGANQQRGYRTLREAVVEGLSAPLRSLRAGGALGRTEGFWALRDVSFDVNQGEIVGVIGRNGAGKSTLLKILSGITPPTRGRAVLSGRVGSLLEVGTGFHQELSGRENVYLNGSILGMGHREIARKFDAIVDYSGVEKFLDTPVKRYSSGMRVRLAFAVAAFLDPEILIVDEVLAVGDAAFQKKCLGRMGEIAKDGRTILFVSHNMAAVQSLCSRGVLLDSGTVLFDGDVDATLLRYQQVMDEARQGDNAAYSPDNPRKGALAWGRIIGVEGRSSNTASLCSETSIEIGLDLKRRLAFPSIGIGIDDQYGRRMLTLHSPVGADSIEYIDNTDVVICRIKQLPLAPGRYSVKLALSEKAAPVDTIEEAFTFDVIDTDTGDGRGFQSGACATLADWQLSGESNKLSAA